MRAILLSIVVVLAASVRAPGQQQPDALPTTEAIQSQIQAGNAADALKHLNRLLSLRGKAAEAYSKYELLTLKGEAHLRLKANEAAATAFRQAAAETDDRQHKAVARATELLIRRSKNLAYTPKKVAKGDKADAIDIIEPEQRHKALAALFVDEVSPLLPKVEAAKNATSVGPMIKSMAAARDMQYLELAANGSADQINGIVDGLKEQGKTMLGRVIEKATKRVDRITTLANDTERVRQLVPLPGGGYRSTTIEKRRGVQREDVTELKGIIDACDEVVAQSKALAQAVGSEEELVEELVESAEDLKLHVQRMLRVHDIEYRGRGGRQDT